MDNFKEGDQKAINKNKFVIVITQYIKHILERGGFEGGGCIIFFTTWWFPPIDSLLLENPPPIFQDLATPEININTW